MPRATKLTEKNVTDIIEDAKLIKFDLSHIVYDMEYYAHYGWETYIITDGTDDLNNITFTTTGSEDFFNTWKFIESESDQFEEIERI